jgi:translation initiation factor 3 subunit J
MGDSWEDWDDDNIALPGANGNAADANAFADEDEEEEAPKWEGTVPRPQQAKPKQSKYDESRGAQAADSGPLDDPLAERLRQQRLVEEADFKAALELFGEGGRDLETFIPKSAKDFEELGQILAAKFLLPHAKTGAAPYKAGLKSLLHAALRPLSANEVKDVETCVSGVRSEKIKEEKALAGGKKTSKRAALNVGKSGGTAGLDDYVYDDPLDDDFDFM